MNGLLSYVETGCRGVACGEAEANYQLLGGLLAFLGSFIVFFLVSAALFFAFWVWMLIDALKRDELSYQKIGSGEKNLWLIILIVSFFFGFSFISFPFNS